MFFFLSTSEYIRTHVYQVHVGTITLLIKLNKNVCKYPKR
jgi:hypothetical protein